MRRTLSIMLWIFLGSVAGLAQQTFYFPQVADGRDSNAATHWHTTIFLSNQSNAAVANGRVTFYQSSGSPMNISFVDEDNQGAAVANQIEFHIPPGQTKKFTSVASGSLQVGYGVVQSDVSVGGNAMFAHWTNPPNEALISEAAIAPAASLTKQALFADTQFGFNTGFAVANPPGGTAATVTFQLVNAKAQLVASPVTRTLNPGEHLSQFVTEMFGAGVGSMAGRLEILAPAGVAAMGLRFDSGFQNFTTLFPFTIP